MATHREMVERARGNMTATQIRAAKCERSRVRSLARKAERREAAEERQKLWDQLTPQQKLRVLLKRPGKSKRQVTRIKKSLDN